MRIWAVVPVKRLADAKSRLASVLTIRQRRELVCLLLSRTLRVLRAFRGRNGILVVGSDRAVRTIARRYGAEFVAEARRGGMNRALSRARSAAVARRADAVLVVPADLPLLSARDIAWLKKKTGRPPFVAIAPDASGRGTNLLYVSPPGLIRFSFGANSFRRHLQSAQHSGITATVLRRRTLARDLDRPEDLASVCDLERRKK